MKATVTDLRRRAREVFRTLDRGESVTILYRSKEKGTIVPATPRRKRVSAVDHPAFGMWKDNPLVRDVEGFVRRLRQPRFSHL